MYAIIHGCRTGCRHGTSLSRVEYCLNQHFHLPKNILAVSDVLLVGKKNGEKVSTAFFTYGRALGTDDCRRQSDR